MRLKQSVKDFLAIVLFELVVLAGMLVLEARFEQLEQQKSADVFAVQTAQNK
jgi:hypothetical protein